MDRNGCVEWNREQQNAELRFRRKCQDQSAMLGRGNWVETGSVGSHISLLCWCCRDPEMAAHGPGGRKPGLPTCLTWVCMHTPTHTHCSLALFPMCLVLPWRLHVDITTAPSWPPA